MSYVGPKGIPYMEFLEWDDFSRAAALGWMVEENITCDSCGTRRGEWDEKQGGSKTAYVAESFVCQGCLAVEEKYEDARTSARRAKRKDHGLKVRLIPLAEHLEKIRKRREDPQWRERMRQERMEEVYGAEGLEHLKERRRRRRGDPLSDLDSDVGSDE